MITRRLSKLVVERSRSILAIWLMLAIGGEAGAAQLRLDNDLLNLLPTEIQAVQVIKELQAQDARQRFAEALQPALSASEWIEDGVAVGVDISRIAHARKTVPGGASIATYLVGPDRGVRSWGQANVRSSFCRRHLWRHRRRRCQGSCRRRRPGQPDPAR